MSSLTIIFKKDKAPKLLNFVFKRENAWYNNGGANYNFALKKPEKLDVPEGTVGEMVEEILRAEVTYGSWTLMHRFNLCNNWIKKIGNENLDGLAWIYVWMRYSELRKLDWQRRYNTRPSELASSQKNLTYTITGLIANASKRGLVSPLMLLRGVLGSFGRGGDNGQRIRDQILEIMHRHRIGEVHGTFLEQWHQKLHNNTTPDDVGICEALIAFFETNNKAKYWEVLNKHGISRERLASFERAITTEPSHMPHLIPDLQNFLGTLKSVHSGTDLVASIDQARPFFSQGVHNKINEILGNIHHWDKLPQIERSVWARLDLNSNANKSNIQQLREILYVDMSLELYIRQLCESIIHINMSPKHLVKELNLLIDNASITFEDDEFKVASGDWKSLSSRYGNSFENNRDITLILKSATDRISRVLGTAVDTYNNLIQPKAKSLGTQFGVEDFFVDLFTEEVIRGSSLFSLSMILKKLDGNFRTIANLKPWQIISPVNNIEGRLLQVESLHEVSYAVYKEPTILIAKRVTGEEEIPEGVLGVVSCTEIDGLAHVSVRARNSKKMLAVCFNEEEVNKLVDFVGQFVNLTIAGGGVVIHPIQAIRNQGHEEEKSSNRVIPKPKPLESIVLQPADFGEGKTGAKATNCAILRSALPETFGVPNQVALPFGVFEYVLGLPANSAIHQRFEKLVASLEGMEHNQAAEGILTALRELVLEIEIPQDKAREIQEQLMTIGCAREDWNAVYLAIKKVWASKFNERAYLSTFKARITMNDIVMSVLCQEVISGDYAYVLHTKDPFTNDESQIYGELVVGLGETLVGGYEGRAFAFTVSKYSDAFTIQSFPNKSVSLRGSGYIFRSDSNSEDLPGFAGAGLFDSIIMHAPKESLLSYADERLCTDLNYCREIIFKLKEIGILVENAFNGYPQDIEGVIKDNKVYVVQSRPQV